MLRQTPSYCNLLAAKLIRPLRTRPLLLSGAALTLLVGLNGCEKPDQITSYRVHKPHILYEINHVDRQGDGAGTESDPGERERMLAAIVPQGPQTWFFKVTGPDQAVAAQKAAFDEFLKSLRFAPGPGTAEPQWTLPKGWKRLPGTAMRFATIEIEAGGKPLELSVIPLPTAPGDSADYILSNVNRWRGQLGLSPMTKDELFDEGEDDETYQIDAGGASVTVVNFVGQMSDSPMSRAPFASGAAPGPAGPLRPSAQPPSSTGTVELTYDVPEGWTEGEAGGFRKAAFEIADGNQNAEVTVIDLAAAGNELPANVNRWRRQIQLAPVSQADLAEHVKKIPVGRSTGDYVELVGPEDASPRQAILGVMTIEGDRAWFIKMMGDAELVLREKPQFEEFVRSVQFRSTDGAENGQ